MRSNNRRTFLKTGILGGFFGYAAIARGDELRATPPEIEGPFYPITPQKDKDFDLTKIDGSSGIAQGRVIWIEGVVLGSNGEPIEDATVDLWQANAAGRYNHPHDPNTASVDPYFQGWAIVQSGKSGTFRFKTIMPGSYPASKTWMRPPHIHFKVSKRGYVELVTQMYFPGNVLNEKDLLIKRKNKSERQLMLSSLVKNDPETYRFQIVLSQA